MPKSCAVLNYSTFTFVEAYLWVSLELIIKNERTWV